MVSLASEDGLFISAVFFSFAFCLLSVTISCVTTRELVCKDFCMESEESLVKRAAHLMVASLAGSLALVTCREPLRVSLTQNLRQLLQPAVSSDCNDLVSPL